MMKRIKRFVHFYFLKKELRFHHADRKAVTFENAKEIGILFDATDTNQSTIVTDFADELKKQKKKTVLLGFYNFPRPAINFTFTYFNKKNLNWYFEPVGADVDSFVNRKFDILINAYAEENLPLEYISALSQASFRIGNYNKQKTYAYDFMIDTGGRKDLKYLCEQFQIYLKKV